MPMKKIKKLTKKNIGRAVWIIYALLSIIIWLPQVDRLFTKEYVSMLTHVSLNDSWDVTINDTLYENVSLDSFSFATVGKGDRITMTCTLPDDWGIVEGVLRLHIRQTAATVLIDDERVYQYGYGRIIQNKTVGSGYLFINFPSDYQGKKLTIRLKLAEDQAFSTIEPIRIYEWKNVYRILLTENRIPMFLGCFLTIFGLVLCFITIFALIYSRKYIRMLCISLFSICMGIWTLCYYNVISIFAIPLFSISMLEYLTLYLAPIPLVIYMWEDVKKLKQKAFKIFYWILFTVLISMTSVMLALHTLDIVHCAATLKYMQALIVFALLYFIIVELLNLKSSQKTDRMFLIGMLIVAACTAYDMLSYCLNRYLGKSLFPINGVTSIGLVIFIFILIASYYMEITQKMMQETERNFLIKSAYTDELTQIHNRRYCMEYMNKIKDSEELNYTVVCFDLNNLKTVNDTYGHAKGDILIKSAADVIAQTFEGHGIVARMGGDEFIAILQTADEQTIAELMKLFQTNIDRKNEEIKDLNMSIAYGYASCSKKEYNIEKIYQIADNRMYQNKEKMKAARFSTTGI